MKVVELEAKDGTKYIDIEGLDPISRFLEYIRPCKGKVKVLKDLDVEKFLLNTPLLLKNVTFEGPYMVRILY